MENKTYTCPKCGKALLVNGTDRFWCANCNIDYKLRNGELERQTPTPTAQMSEFLEFKNPGKLIRTIGKIFYLLMIIAVTIFSIAGGYIDDSRGFVGFLYIIGTVIVGFLMYLGIYAFGSLVENVQKIADRK